MNKIRIGILSPSEIATRRFLPALGGSAEFVGMAVADKSEWAGEIGDDAFRAINEKEREKAAAILEKFGGRLFESYGALINSPDVDAVYAPLPPALHFHWGMTALNAGKHVLLEKPLTVDLEDTKKLLSAAREKDLLIYENFAFEFHKQIERIKEIVASGTLGEIRQIRASFGFPYRGARDFRYEKSLGGGAVNDCGGYPIKLASVLLGKTIKTTFAKLGSSRRHNVDTYGTAAFVNDEGTVAITSFGMDNTYKCELEIWGSKNTLLAPRVFTPPADFETQLIVTGEDPQEIRVEPDDYFKNSIDRFIRYTSGDKETIYEQILLQNELMESVRREL
ncbi:MAG: Gfo/Idh/MocA family oxidoreductase [Oscillibacter sp.]|nr:Gfo/Idh/MocA family oxidoreductase [Oscillibacter sp.]